MKPLNLFSGKSRTPAEREATYALMDIGKEMGLPITDLVGNSNWAKEVELAVIAYKERINKEFEKIKERLQQIVKSTDGTIFENLDKLCNEKTIIDRQVTHKLWEKCVEIGILNDGGTWEHVIENQLIPKIKKLQNNQSQTATALEQSQTAKDQNSSCKVCEADLDNLLKILQINGRENPTIEIKWAYVTEQVKKIQEERNGGGTKGIYDELHMLCRELGIELHGKGWAKEIKEYIIPAVAKLTTNKDYLSYPDHIGKEFFEIFKELGNLVNKPHAKTGQKYTDWLIKEVIPEIERLKNENKMVFAAGMNVKTQVDEICKLLAVPASDGWPRNLEKCIEQIKRLITIDSNSCGINVSGALINLGGEIGVATNIKSWPEFISKDLTAGIRKIKDTVALPIIAYDTLNEIGRHIGVENHACNWKKFLENIKTTILKMPISGGSFDVQTRIDKICRLMEIKPYSGWHNNLDEVIKKLENSTHKSKILDCIENSECGNNNC